MRYSLYVHDEIPAVAAAIMRERAQLQLDGKVYVKPYVRNWPGGLVAARRALEKKRAGKKRGALLRFFGSTKQRAAG